MSFPAPDPRVLLTGCLFSNFAIPLVAPSDTPSAKCESWLAFIWMRRPISMVEDPAAIEESLSTSAI